MPTNRPIVKPSKPQRRKAQPEKPRPTCLRLMVADDGGVFACPKHGAPTRP